MIAIAWTMITIWPLVTAILFRLFSLPAALSATLIGGYLLLPTRIQIDLPVVPPIDKYTIPALSALICTLVVVARRKDTRDVLKGWLPRNRFALVMISLLILGAFGTALTNGDRQVFGPRALPSLSLYDSLSIGLGHAMMLLPFFLARKLLATPEAQRTFLKVLVVAALAYSVLALWEVRMSPQLNRTFYGFFPHSWIQHIRGGGFRPIVFLQHGLFLGIFLSCAIIAAAGLSRVLQTGRKGIWMLAVVWLFGTMVLSKVFGALLITCALIPFTFLHARIQLLAAATLATMVLAYPMLRAADVLPVDRVVTFAGQFSDERAGSLQYRLDHETTLLEHARERPVFGWGGYGRNRVFSDTGRDLSTTDGTWIIIFGQGGWIRYIAEFGLLTGGLILLAIRRRQVDPIFGVTALVLVANLIDLLPNSGVSPITWMLAGSVFGYLERRAHVSQPEEEEVITDKWSPTYQRDFTGAARPSSEAPALTTGPVLRRDFGASGRHRRGEG